MRNTPRTTLTTIFLGSILGACGGSGGGAIVQNPGAPDPSPSPDSTITEKYRGVWRADAYGRALEITSDSLRLYDFTSEYCLLAVDETDVNLADIEGLFRIAAGQLEDFGSNGTATFSAPGTLYDSVTDLPAVCADSVLPGPDGRGYQRNPERELAIFYQLVNELSIYPELRERDVLSLYTEQAALLSDQSSDDDLAEALFQLVAPFADIHMTVEGDFGAIKVLNKPTLVTLLFNEWLELEGALPPLSQQQVQSANAYIDGQLELDRSITLSYLSEQTTVRSAANGLVHWSSADNVGYLAIDAMLGFADSNDNGAELSAVDAAMDQVLDDLQDVEALVVDIRRNGGGKDFVSLAIASRFAANNTLVYRKQARLGQTRTPLRDIHISPRGSRQYLGPVFLLTSATTASAAETFTLAMRALPQVTVIGEATQGGLSDQLDKRLGNGWSASVANEFYVSPEGELFETRGIPVDIAVPQFSREARLSAVDAGLEAVIARLND